MIFKVSALQRNRTKYVKVQKRLKILKHPFCLKQYISNENHHLFTMYSLPTNTCAPSDMGHNFILICQNRLNFVFANHHDWQFWTETNKQSCIILFAASWSVILSKCKVLLLTKLYEIQVYIRYVLPRQAPELLWIVYLSSFLNFCINADLSVAKLSFLLQGSLPLWAWVIIIFAYISK